MIEADAMSAGLPPPLLLSVPDASQLAFVLQGERTSGSFVQLLAARNGEGTSTLVRDLCLVSAANGARTLLLAAEAPSNQADWPRSVYGMPSGLQAFAGVTPGLQMIRVGQSCLALAAPAGPSPLQLSMWMGLIGDIRGQFDLVVVDAPALERSFTGIMLAPHLDATALVVAAESTRASAARILRDRLSEVGSDVVGVVLNKRRFHVPRAAYERL